MLMKRGRCFFGRETIAFVDREGRSRRIGRTRNHLKSPKALAKPHLRLTMNHRLRVVIALHGPNPIVGTILKIADTTMSVSHRPTGDEFLLEVSNIIAIDIFQIDRRLSILNQSTSTIDHQSRWMLRCCAKIVNLSARPSPSVSSQILMRSRPCPCGCKFVRIIDRLANPKPPLFIPVHGDRFAFETCASRLFALPFRPIFLELFGPQR